MFGRFAIYAMCLIMAFPLMCCSATKQDKAPPEAQEKPNVVHVGPIAPDMLGLTIQAGRVEYGEQGPYRQEKGDSSRLDEASGTSWISRGGRVIGALSSDGTRMITVDRVVGQRIDSDSLDRRESFAISSPDDSDYTSSLTPERVFRKSKPTDLARTGTGVDAPMEHTCYLKLPKPLKEGKRYVLSIKVNGLPEQKFVYDSTAMRSEAVHVSHVGFRPDDPSKVAFLSLWAGSGGGVDFSDRKKFAVLDEKTGHAMFKGEVKLSKRASDKDEDAYGRNFNLVDVYIMDFSPLDQPGSYRVCVERVGCSYPFEIADNVWDKAFYVSVRGLYHQRSGIELGPPYTTFTRPRMFHPDDGVKVYASGTPLMDTTNGFAQTGDPGRMLLAKKTSEILPNAWGGYCDAGDWDRRIQHLEAARFLLEFADLFPSHFERVVLNIPKTYEDLPDFLNEALWGVDFYGRLQMPDGGVRGGVETESHPRYGEASWQNTLTVMAYAPDVWSTYLFAGVAARASHVLKGRSKALSERYLQSALKAMGWAERELKANGPHRYPFQVRDARNLAAAELLRATGKKEWHSLFVETTVFADPLKPLYRHASHDQSEAAWIFSTTPWQGADPVLKSACKNAIINEANTRTQNQSKTAFKWSKDLWRPAIGGTFSTPDCTNFIRAHILTGKKEYLQAAVLAAQTGAGANPLNLSYTTGVGHRYPQHVLHWDSRILRRPPPPGLTALGPLDIDHLGGPQSPIHMYPGQFCYPRAADWPVIENYWDVFWYPMMCEYTVHQSISPNAYTWGYLAARR